jgi:hypothetical protein
MEINVLYGCATTGSDWVFLKLDKNIIYIDAHKYYISQLDNILGNFQEIIDYYKNILG